MDRRSPPPMLAEGKVAHWRVWSIFLLSEQLQTRLSDQRRGGQVIPTDVRLLGFSRSGE